ncbi:hypothetical protein E8E13_001800 [Curvularia kusanoi]|uniref:Ubiquitin 3 binding protein But2 C-terminal domain-containing protein n=1 Tax=Curvularia kusanoi TaxID=90978 RepID=A0A9P4TKU0_CURKU|nr:hypothetical protein E8E13_001800 [Curvularia kusanoi]
MHLTRPPTLLTLLLPQALAAPRPWPWSFTNTTSAVDPTSTDLEMPHDSSAATDITNTTLSASSNGPYICQYAYPSDMTVVNSRYPDYSHHLHQAHSFFMLRRQVAELGEVATRVQFTDLPAAESNTTCRLEFILPREDTQRISGENPTFNVYSVERAPGARATWETYEGNDNNVTVFGVQNGEPQALAQIRSAGGVAALGQTICNDTMTFQMGMKYDVEPDAMPNYWRFSNVAPPAMPTQGFRIVWGC